MLGRRSFVSAASLVAALPAVVACQRRITVSSLVLYSSPVNGVGRMYLVGTLAAAAREHALVTMERLIYEDARTIQVAMLSAAGDLASARTLGDFMTTAHDSRNIDFEAYNVGVVGTPATYVYLSAQRRYARPGSTFLFSAPAAAGPGAAPGQGSPAATGVEGYEAALRRLFRAKTRLSPDAIDVYLRRIVVLPAEDARRDGLVDALRDFPVPFAAPASAPVASAATP